MEFSDWFSKESGYTLHPPKLQKQLSGCCQAAADTQKLLLLPVPGKESLRCLLYRCPACGKYYARHPDGWMLVENLLRYQVISG